MQVRNLNSCQRFNFKKIVHENADILLGYKKGEPVNVDELVAKIDQKIEELEAEEKAKDENKIVIDKEVKRVEIEKNRVIIYY